ncbi:MAG TPA: TonB-dependent receptor, partial [Bacteroidota bacterium]|nr:TonB-dependent receptor [Bacteroidota bacterium]
AASSNGSITVHRSSIPDTGSVSASLVVGGETGDQLIHLYTRHGGGYYNKNKIGPSGYVSFSDRSKNVRYRLSGGTFGYYITGGPLDVIIPQIDPEDAWDKNIRFVATGEVEYSDGQSLYSFWAGLSANAAWELTPFAPSFGMYSSLISTVRAEAKNLFNGVSMSLRRDGSALELKEQVGASGGEIDASEYGLITVFDAIQNTKIGVQIATDLSRMIARSSHHRQLLQNDVDLISIGMSGMIHYAIAPSTKLRGRGRYEYRQSTWKVSGTLGLELAIADGHFIMGEVSSVSQFPGLYELYGMFSIRRALPPAASVDTFAVAGSKSLVPQRTNSVRISYRLHHDELWSFSATAFSHVLRGPIGKRILRTVRTSIPGDIVHVAIYSNLSDRHLNGLDGNLEVSLWDVLQCRAGYAYLENGDVPSSPRHSGNVNITWNSQTLTTIAVSGKYLSRRMWKEFRLSAENDYLSGDGFDGTIPPTFSVDITVEQRLKNLFFPSEIFLKLEILNLFDRPIQFLPVGNRLSTTILLNAGLTL